MKDLYIRNTCKPLHGCIPINGAKNSALPIMAATILTNTGIELQNIPNILDIHTMSDLLVHLGADVKFIYNPHINANHTIKINCSNIHNTLAPTNIVDKMRASILVLGPLLVRFNHATVAFPGGCTIGKRPINMHLEALSKMGASITITDNHIKAKVTGKLRGAHIKFDMISVGATENIMMAASLAEGETIIENAAMEPEVVDLANFLVKSGANIKGIGTSKLTICGVDALNGCSHSIIPDRLEAGTYALAAIMTNGTLEMHGITLSDIQCIYGSLIAIGAKIISKSNSIIVSRRDKHLHPINISTSPHPGFPSDMQSQFTAALCLAKGKSQIIENIFENRFMYVPELRKMNANITMQNNKILIEGIDELKANSITASDLRASAALLLASIVAKGTTHIKNAYHIYRGYEAIEQKLNACGADITPINDETIQHYIAT